MNASLIDYINNQALMKVIRAFIQSNKPLHLRGISYITSLSVGGVVDNIDKLIANKLITESRIKNKRYFSLCINESEYQLFKAFIDIYEINLVKDSALNTNKTIKSKLNEIKNIYSISKIMKKK